MSFLKNYSPYKNKKCPNKRHTFKKIYINGKIIECMGHMTSMTTKILMMVESLENEVYF